MDRTDIQYWEQQAEKRDMPLGRGRAAWVVSRWHEQVDGMRVRFNTPFSRPYICDDCGGEFGDHGPVQMVIPTDGDDNKPTGVLAGPFCPACVVDRLRGGLG